MFHQLFALLAIHASQPAIVAIGGVPRPVAAPAVPETMAVRIEAAGGVLWDGTLRVAVGQGASYQQHLNQAAGQQCPAENVNDRSERSQLTVSVYTQQNQQLNRSYRVDVSWQRPIPERSCLESGTRTVQVTQAISLAPGETKTVEGDAGLRVRLTLGR